METQNTQINEKENTLHNSEAEETNAPSSKSSEKAQLTKESLEFLRIKEAVLESDEIDNTEKIARLKKLIASGQYDVDLDELSEKITRDLLS